MNHDTRNAAPPQDTHPDDVLPPYVEAAFAASAGEHARRPTSGTAGPRQKPSFGARASGQRVDLQFGNAALVVFTIADELDNSANALMPALAATGALLQCVHRASLDETNIEPSTLRDAIGGIQVLARLATAFANDTRVLLRGQGGNGNG